MNSYSTFVACCCRLVGSIHKFYPEYCQKIHKQRRPNRGPPEDQHAHNQCNDAANKVHHHNLCMMRSDSSFLRIESPFTRPSSNPLSSHPRSYQNCPQVRVQTSPTHE